MPALCFFAPGAMRGMSRTSWKSSICDLLKPFNPALMRRYEVSSRVNLVKNDDAACAEPWNEAYL
jgi:putative SOS response-associated peptidase YedK